MTFRIETGSQMPSARDIPERIEDRLIVALDVPSIAEARTLVAKLDNVVSFFKIGYWLQFAAGVDRLFDDLTQRNKKIFLDTKMFDIGETVKRGIAQIAERGINFVTVHSDKDVMCAAAEGKRGSDLQILVVPVLTSRDASSLHELGYQGEVADLIVGRARMALACGCDGIIAAPRDNPNEIRRAAVSEELLVVTPGVRLPGSSVDDHRRAGSPAEAIAAGSDYIVVGRPIIRSDDPARAAERIIDDMRGAA
jgi:orotidine-5'-phosphate decarboxylase